MPTIVPSWRWYLRRCMTPLALHTHADKGNVLQPHRADRAPDPGQRDIEGPRGKRAAGDGQHAVERYDLRAGRNGQFLVHRVDDGSRDAIRTDFDIHEGIARPRRNAV